MVPSLGTYIGTITATDGASGSIDLSAYPLAGLWLQVVSDGTRIVPGSSASNTPGATYGVSFDAGQLFPHDLRGSHLSAIAVDGTSTVTVDVFVRLG